jgi:hypothetical protein
MPWHKEGNDLSMKAFPGNGASVESQVAVAEPQGTRSDIMGEGFIEMCAPGRAVHTE